jgi:hypothetical protein
MLLAQNSKYAFARFGVWLDMRNVITNRTILEKAVSRLVRLSFWLLAKAKFMGNVDLARVMTNNIENILNLQGKLPFFPMQATPAERVGALIQRLHPVRCDRELIRLGPDSDGGYLAPNDLDGVEVCFSPGVSDVAGFEHDCAERGMMVFMADASVDGPPEVHPRFRFLKKFVGPSTNGEFISLEDWITNSVNGRPGDLLLQMDIEGAEYETLLSIPSGLQNRFRIMIVEFHCLDYLFSEPMFSIYSKVFEKLLTTHTCVHIHPNNVCRLIKAGELEIPQMAEFTFLRNDRISRPKYATTFPHPLDRNNVEKPVIPLPKSCYHSQSNGSVMLNCSIKKT